MYIHTLRTMIFESVFKYFPTSISSVALASLEGSIARILCVLVVFAVQVIPAVFYNTQTPVYLLPKKSIVPMPLTNDRQKKSPRVIKSSENEFRDRKEGPGPRANGSRLAVRDKPNGIVFYRRG